LRIERGQLRIRAAVLEGLDLPGVVLAQAWPGGAGPDTGLVLALQHVHEHAAAPRGQGVDILLAGDHQSLQRERRALPVAVKAADVHADVEVGHGDFMLLDPHPVPRRLPAPARSHTLRVRAPPPRHRARRQALLYRRLRARVERNRSIGRGGVHRPALPWPREWHRRAALWCWKGWSALPLTGPTR